MGPPGQPVQIEHDAQPKGDLKRGLVYAFEAAIYVAALVLAVLCIRDWLRTGSGLSLATVVIVTLYGHWPLVRNRLLKS